jgi:hypothetical protein
MYLMLFAADPQKNILKGGHRDPIARDTKGLEITIQKLEEFCELRCQMRRDLEGHLSRYL